MSLDVLRRWRHGLLTLAAAGALQLRLGSHRLWQMAFAAGRSVKRFCSEGEATMGTLDRWVVKQTSDVAGEYSDIAVTNLYVSVARQFMTEGQLIWSRFNAMLVANSIIFLLIGRALEGGIEGEQLTRGAILLVLIAGFFGVILSIAWLNLNLRSLRLQRYWRECAIRFDWEKLPNPTRYAYERWAEERGKGSGNYGILGKPAIFVIVMFIAAHCTMTLVGLHLYFWP